MTLTDFIDARCKELGITKQYMLDTADLDWSVLTNIKKGKSIRQETKQKLAIGLQCTIGDINAALASTPHPLRKEAEKPEGTAGISITAKAKKKPKPEAPAPDPKDEEPAEVFQPDVDTEVDMMFPVEEVDPKETLAEFKARLTQMVFREMLVTESSLTSLVLQNIGKKLVEELIGGDKE